MLYLERLPHPALAPFIHNFWYSCDPAVTHSFERILPNGRPQIVISLSRNYLTNANHPTDPRLPQPAALFLGIYSHHQLIDTIDLTELIGVSFHPGGTVPFFPDTTHTFTNLETSLEDLVEPPTLDLRNTFAKPQPPRRNSTCSLRPPPSSQGKPSPTPHTNHRLRPREAPTLARHHHRQ